jgi:hypothetical protein
MVVVRNGTWIMDNLKLEESTGKYIINASKTSVSLDELVDMVHVGLTVGSIVIWRLIVKYPVHLV